jgi:hypothetical protein
LIDSENDVIKSNTQGKPSLFFQERALRAAAAGGRIQVSGFFSCGGENPTAYKAAGATIGGSA